jgi:hypothetical protein
MPDVQADSADTAPDGGPPPTLFAS